MPKVKVFKTMSLGPLDLALPSVQAHKLAMSDFSALDGLADPLGLVCPAIGNWAAGPGGANCNNK